MIKKLQLCFMALAAILILSACAGSQQPAGSGAPANKADETKAAPVTEAWKAKWDKTLADARREGKVVVYGEAGPSLRTEVSKAFKDKFGIELEFVTGVSLEIAQKYMTERTANLYLADVILMGNTTLLLQVKPKGFLGPISPQFILPEVLDSKAWNGGKIPLLDRDGTVLPLTQGYYSYVFINTDMVKDNEIKSLFDLTDPKWKSKITMYNPTISGSTINWVNFVLTKFMDNEKGQQYLKDLAKNEPFLTNDKRLHIEWVARGKYAVGIGPNMQSLSEFVSSGAPIKSIRVKEGGGISPSSSCIALPDKMPHPATATILVNWLLSAEGQTVFSNAFGQPGIRLGTPVAGIIDPFTVVIPGETAYWADEEFTLQQEQAMVIAKQIFGPLLK